MAVNITILLQIVPVFLLSSNLQTSNGHQDPTWCLPLEHSLMTKYPNGHQYLTQCLPWELYLASSTPLGIQHYYPVCQWFLIIISNTQCLHINKISSNWPVLFHSAAISYDFFNTSFYDISLFNSHSPSPTNSDSSFP